MTFILVDDEQKCNFCVYWTGMRKSGEGCSRWKIGKSMLRDPRDI